jgi:cell wall-associated NlpC family hydrolase
VRTPSSGSTRSALRRASGRAVLGALAGVSCTALALPSTGAFADPGPSPTPGSTTSVGPGAGPATGGAADVAVNAGLIGGMLTDGQLDDAKKRAADKAAQVQAIQAQYSVAAAKLQQVRDAAEIAAEKYNAAELLLEQRTAAADAAGARAGAAVQAAKEAQDRVGSLAAHSYIEGGNLGDLEPFLTKGGPQELLDRAAMLGTLSDIRDRGLQQAQATNTVAAVLQRQAAQAQAEQLAAAQTAQEAKDAAQAAADDASAQTAELKRRQDAMVLELAALEQTSLALQQEHQAALQSENDRRTRAAAIKLYGAGHAGSGSDPTGAAAPSARIVAVIDFAKAQVGKWYLWGGAGPDRFDCSGLTMRAWEKAGVSLGHYTGWQYAHTKHVSIADRRPGDLIFYGPDVAGIHHVGLYIGNDMMIEAPHTGAQIRYAGIWRSDMIVTLARP